MSQIVLQQSVYQGTVVSSALPWVPGASVAVATGLMSAADAADASQTLTMYVAASYDAQGVGWRRESSYSWQGGPNGGNAPPVMGWQPGAPPTFVRVEFDIPAPFSVGASLDVS